MGEDIYKTIFSKNLKHYMDINNKTQTDLINDLGFNKSAISTWCNGTRLPRMDKVDMLARYFHIERSDLIEDKDTKLNDRDNHDIKKDLDSIMERLTNKAAGPASYDGEDLSPEAAELFKDELEIALRRLKLINKEKYNPNKNKK